MLGHVRKFVFAMVVFGVLFFLGYAAVDVSQDMHEAVDHAHAMAEAREALIEEMRAEHGPCIHMRGDRYLCETALCEVGGDCISRQNLNITVTPNNLILESQSWQPQCN